MDRRKILTVWTLAVFLVIPLTAFSGDSSEPQIGNTKCPTVEVRGPRKSKALKTISYRAKVKDFSSATPPIFNWSVVGGYLLEGQGSETITVEPLALEVRATLMIENTPTGCPSNSDTAVTKITDIPWMHPPPVIRSINASPSLIVRRCPVGTKSDTCAATGDEVQLRADATAPVFGTLLFTWSVSAGRLKGEGNTVTWDLSGVASGTYTVVVEVGYFESKAACSTTVKVTECKECKPSPTMDATKPSESPSPPRVTSRALLRSMDTLH